MEIQYSDDLKSAWARKTHKLSVLSHNPECLYADHAEFMDKRIRTNLIFHTEHIDLWKAILCQQFPLANHKKIYNGYQISSENEGLACSVQTVNLYKNGTVLVQGNEASLLVFENLFPSLKTEVDELLALSPGHEKDHGPNEEMEVPNSHLPISQCSPVDFLKEMQILTTLFQKQRDEHQRMMSAIEDLEENNKALHQEVHRVKKELADREQHEQSLQSQLDEMRKIVTVAAAPQPTYHHPSHNRPG